MSHYTVIITNTSEEDVDQQLEGYNESGETDDWFIEKSIEVEKDEVELVAKNLVNEQLKTHKEFVKKRREAKRLFKETDDWAKDKNLESKLEHEARYDNYFERIHKEYKELVDAGNFKEVVERHHGGQWDENGNLVSYYNPNAKWDWYSVGGRWTGFFKLKPGVKHTPVIAGHFSTTDKEREKLLKAKRTDVAYVKDIDWEKMKANAKKKAEEQWEAYLTEDKDKLPFFSTREKGDTKETFVKRQGRIAPFAVLDGGEWYERGSMGWFGIASDEKPGTQWEDWFDEKVEDWIKNNPDMELTLVDLHI